MNRDYAKGMAKVKENDFHAAIECFTIAIDADSSDVECYAERAVAYLNTNQYELSMFDMNRCIELEPKNSYRFSCRAFLKSRMGDMEGAITDYEIAITLDPDDAIAYNNLGLAQENKGYQKQAEKSFQKSNELIGYNPKKFDEGEKQKTEHITYSSVKSTQTVATNISTETSPTKSEIAKGVFTKKSSFKDFLKFIRNGFKIKE